jgi:hypothetical protein
LAIPFTAMSIDFVQIQTVLSRVDADLSLLSTLEGQLSALPGQGGAYAKAALAATGVLRLFINELRQVIGQLHPAQGVKVVAPEPAAPAPPAVAPGSAVPPTVNP